MPISLDSSFKLDLVTTYEDGKWGSYDPTAPDIANAFNSLEPGKGYWVKLSKIAGEVTTLDGYKIKLLTSFSTADTEALTDTIEHSTLEEVLTISSWDKINSIEIVSDVTSKEYSTSSLSGIDIDTLKSELAHGAISASVYIYGISEGSAPYALADSLVYKVNDDETTTLLGNTDVNGFISSPSIEKGTKLLIKKDGMVDKIYTVNEVGTLYIFMSEDNALELPAEEPSSTGSARLDYIRETFKHTGNVGYYTPSAKFSILRRLPVRKIKATTIDSLDDSDTLKALVDSKAKDGYKSTILSSFDFYLKVSKRLGGKAYGSFSKYYPSDILPKIVITTPDIDYSTIKDAIDGKGSSLRVFYYDGEWKEKADASITLKKLSEENTKVKASFAKKYSLTTPVLEITGTGFYPHVVVVDKKVSFKYPLNIKVTDTEGNPLDGVAVFAGKSLIGTTASGSLDYNVTAGYGDSKVYLKAMKTDYKSDTTMVNIADLTPSIENNVTLKLEKIASTASVEGFVYDKNESTPVYLSKVKLYFPYALAYVKADEVVDGELGLKVGYQPGTTYKWYMKIHDDTSISGKASARISKERWLLVKDASSSEKGNFLSYQDMKKMIIAAKESGDAEDVKSMVSGVFDIALIAEHDIDGDGKTDIVELATTDDNVKTDFTSTYDDETKIDSYAKMIGTVKFNFDVEKFAKKAEITNDIVPAVKVDGSWYLAEDSYDDYKSNVGLIDSGVAEDDYNFKVTINNEDNYFTYSGIHDDTLATHDYTINYAVALNGDVTTKDVADKGVMLVKTESGYKWKVIPTTVEDNAQYTYLYDNNATIIVGKKIYNASTKSYEEFDGLIPYSRVSKIISSNEIMDKLNMTLSQIADEAELSDDVKNAIKESGDENKTFISTGMNITPIVDIHTKNKDGKDIVLIEGESLQQSAIDVTKYILTGAVDVMPPVSAPMSLTDTTDRSGKFIFSKLPMDYAKLDGKDISLLTIKAKKYAHYDSPLINVPTYEKGDVENLKINLPSKDLVNVKVNVVDEDGKAVEANVSIDGQYKEIKSILDDYKEYSSVESKIASLAEFDDIIAGRRIITVIKDGYYPQTISESVYKDKINEINVTLKSVSDIDDVIAPSLGLASYVSDEINGLIKLTLVGFDTEDYTLKKDSDGNFISELIVYNNGKIIHPSVTMTEDGEISVVITTPLIGENEISAKLINPKGESSISPVNISFYPTVGSIKGHISDFIDENADSKIDDGYMASVNIYDDKMNYLETIMVNDDGSYLIPMVPIGAVYLQAELMNEYGAVVQKSDFIKTIVGVGIAKTVTLPLKDTSADTSSWIPVVDFDPGISEADLEAQAKDNNGTITIKGEVSTFDPTGQVTILVNYDAYILTSDDLTEEDADKGIYHFEKDINLSTGLNKIVVQALNPNGYFDATPILDVKYGEKAIYKVDINILDEDNNTIPYASLNIINPSKGIYETFDTDENGSISFEVPYDTSSYEVDAYAPGYMGSATYIKDLKALDIKDGVEDKKVDINITLTSETYMSSWSIENVDYKQDVSFDIPDGIVVVDKVVNFDIMPDDGKVHSYKVTILDESGSVVDTIDVDKTNKFDYSFDSKGNYEVLVEDEKGTVNYSFYLNVADLSEVLPTAPVAPVIPTPTPTF